MKIIENIRFHNLRKLAEAKKVAGDDFEALVAEYERLAGYCEVVKEEKKPTVVEKVKKATTRAKKTKK